MFQKIHALLFDLDGTLIDTGELHYDATVKALNALGARLIGKPMIKASVAITTPTLRNFCFRMEVLAAMRNMWI